MAQTYTQLAAQVKDELHVTDNEIDDAAMLNLVKGVLTSIQGRGLLMEMSEEPVVASAEAPIATGMLYLKNVVETSGAGGTYTSEVQPWGYTLYSDAVGVAKIQFKNTFTAPSNIRIEGLGPVDDPSDAVLGDNCPEGFEAIVHQGVRVSALGRLSSGRSELAADRAEQRREEKVVFEETLNQLATAQVSRLLEGEYQRVPGR